MLGTGIFRKSQGLNLATEIQSSEDALNKSRLAVKRKSEELAALKTTDPAYEQRRQIVSADLTAAREHEVSVQRRLTTLRSIGSGERRLNIAEEIQLAELSLANCADEVEMARRGLLELAQSEAALLVAGGETDSDFAKRRKVAQLAIKEAEERRRAAQERLESLQGMLISKARTNASAKAAAVRKKFCDGALSLLETYEQCVSRKAELRALAQQEHEVIFEYNQSARNAGEKLISTQLPESRVWELIPVFNVEPKNVKTTLSNARKKLGHILDAGGE